MAEQSNDDQLGHHHNGGHPIQHGEQSRFEESRSAHEQQAPPAYNQDSDDIVQVIYQSNREGDFVGVHSQLVDSSGAVGLEPSFAYQAGGGPFCCEADAVAQEQLLPSSEALGALHEQQQQSRAGSTLPSVLEESSGSGGTAPGAFNPCGADAEASSIYYNNSDFPADECTFRSVSRSLAGEFQGDESSTTLETSATIVAREAPPADQATLSSASNAPLSPEPQQTEAYQQQVSNLNAIYSTINRQDRAQLQQETVESGVSNFEQSQAASFYPDAGLYTEVCQPSGQDEVGSDRAPSEQSNAHAEYPDEASPLPLKRRPSDDERAELALAGHTKENDEPDTEEDVNAEIRQLLSRNKPGAVESGSFRRDFRKKLGLSISSNENDLTAHRQKLLESQAGNADLSPVDGNTSGGINQYLSPNEHEASSSKFKRTHSVSFNVAGSRAGRLSVDLRNLPSYLTNKRTSIVDAVKGGMSSLFHGFGGGGGGGGGGSGAASATGSDKLPPEEEELIFEEPIAPTLSLGQRVALVREGVTEFGTVGWIGQLPDVDDDWIVGVIFDNMIGDCDGDYKGTRYFYARENYAMFVPLSSLTKTDNYIGRPETGTMLSRMSVSLKPGQLISIQRSSIRLQHCFLNAPHQRVGHDVRAVSNRLHCQCHNCGPCAHLTKKQGRLGAQMPYHLQSYSRQHHHAPSKKNSLAHAAVEIIAHHHHHYHDEEEEHEEEEQQYHFGDNAAHACNFVRYSCCQQTGSAGHGFSADCNMVRPELLDNLIHAPRAPTRQPRLRRRRAQRVHGRQQIEAGAQQMRQIDPVTGEPEPLGEADANQGMSTLSTNATGETMCANGGTIKSWNPSEMTNTTTATATTSHTIYNTSSCSSSPSSSHASDEESSSDSITDDEDLNEADEDRQRRRQPQQQHSGNYRSPGAFHEACSYRYRSESYIQSANGLQNTLDSQISIMDQRRYIHQRDSSAFLRSRISTNFSDDYDDDESFRSAGLGSRIKRCFPCIFKRFRRGPEDSSRSKRSKRRRKLSARDRLMEYRRRQSTFVPSTLAKPREDFASHGIIVDSLAASSYMNNQYPQAASNSDYSSYSNKSSCASSRNHSPEHYSGVNYGENIVSGMLQNGEFQQQTMSIEQFSDANDQLKSSCHYHRSDSGANMNIHGDENNNEQSYSDEAGSYKKSVSALTDLGFNDTMTSNSNDTLKKIVDKSINEEVAQPEQILSDRFDEFISPIESSSRCSPSEQIQISSPTASVADQFDEEDVSREMSQLELNQEECDPPEQQKRDEESQE